MTSRQCSYMQKDQRWVAASEPAAGPSPAAAAEGPRRGKSLRHESQGEPPRGTGATTVGARSISAHRVPRSLPMEGYSFRLESRNDRASEPQASIAHSSRKGTSSPHCALRRHVASEAKSMGNRSQPASRIPLPRGSGTHHRAVARCPLGIIARLPSSEHA
jgi:hypothetical protein